MELSEQDLKTLSEYIGKVVSSFGVKHELWLERAAGKITIEEYLAYKTVLEKLGIWQQDTSDYSEMETPEGKPVELERPQRRLFR